MTAVFSLSATAAPLEVSAANTTTVDEAFDTLPSAFNSVDGITLETDGENKFLKVDTAQTGSDTLNKNIYDAKVAFYGTYLLTFDYKWTPEAGYEGNPTVAVRLRLKNTNGSETYNYSTNPQVYTNTEDWSGSQADMFVGDGEWHTYMAPILCTYSENQWQGITLDVKGNENSGVYCFDNVKFRPMTDELAELYNPVAMSGQTRGAGMKTTKAEWTADGLKISAGGRVQKYMVQLKKNTWYRLSYTYSGNGLEAQMNSNGSYHGGGVSWSYLRDVSSAVTAPTVWSSSFKNGDAQTAFALILKNTAQSGETVISDIKIESFEIGAEENAGTVKITYPNDNTSNSDGKVWHPYLLIGEYNQQNILVNGFVVTQNEAGEYVYTKTNAENAVKCFLWKEKTRMIPMVDAFGAE